MNNREYVEGVRRFGSATPFLDENGVRRNLDSKASLPPEAIKTDGKGNIIDMPPVRRKWCLGRPERFVRGCYDLAMPPFSARNQSPNWRLSKCQRCKLSVECATVATERIESSSTINAAFQDWASYADTLVDKDKFDGRGRRLWNAFLDAIISHGGWSTVNDERVAAAAVNLINIRKAAVDNKKAEGRSARSRSSGLVVHHVTLAFMVALEKEAERRFGVLLDLRQQRDAPRSISRLSADGCRRTTDVWVAHALLTRLAVKPTGAKIARWLLDNGKDQGIKRETLVTWVYKDLDRIKMLEKECRDGPIWKSFDFSS